VTDYPATEVCVKCGERLPFTPRPQTAHYGYVRCPEHGVIWIPKPGKANKARRSPDTNIHNHVPSGRKDFCWICLRRASFLAQLRPSLQLHIHHVIPLSEGGKSETDNLMVLCSECHTDVHRRREAFTRYQPFTDEAV
jgi:5-methylcytosine-specific restriction endonuclease McrA